MTDRPMIERINPDIYDEIAGAIAEVAALAAELDDPKRNIIGITADRLAYTKIMLAGLMRRAGGSHD